MTFEASRLTVLATTAPQPSWKALAITFRLVPGGPDAMINGLGSLSPSTVIDRFRILIPFSIASPNPDHQLVSQKFQAASHESSLIDRNQEGFAEEEVERHWIALQGQLPHHRKC